jgi:uncharacterized protein YfiM (DUF2279 family)
MKWTVLFSLTLGGPQQKGPADPWIGLDKWKHFAVCSVIESVGYGLSRGGQGRDASLRIGAATVAVVGVGRELHDWRVKGQFSGKDLTWDALGAGAAALAIRAAK